MRWAPQGRHRGLPLRFSLPQLPAWLGVLGGCISGQTQGSAPTIFFASITRLVTCMGGCISGQTQGSAPTPLNPGCRGNPPWLPVCLCAWIGAFPGRHRGLPLRFSLPQLPAWLHAWAAQSGQTQGPAPTIFFATNCPETLPLSAIKNNAER